MLRQFQEELFELGSVSWVASLLRVMNQSSRRKQPERRKGWMRRRSNSEGLMMEIRQTEREHAVTTCWKSSSEHAPHPERALGQNLKGWEGLEEAQFCGLWGLRPLVFYTYTVSLHSVAGKKGCELLPVVWARDMTVYPSAAHKMKTWRKIFEEELFLPYSCHSSWF